MFSTQPLPDRLEPVVLPVFNTRSHTQQPAVLCSVPPPVYCTSYAKCTAKQPPQPSCRRPSPDERLSNLTTVGRSPRSQACAQTMTVRQQQMRMRTGGMNHLGHVVEVVTSTALAAAPLAAAPICIVNHCLPCRCLMRG